MLKRAGAGTQILLPLVAALVPPGRAAVLSPTYAEHRRAAALIGHETVETGDFPALRSADLAIVVNPNNPDGRIVGRAALLQLAAEMRRRGGLLVIDEAFMDATDGAERIVFYYYGIVLLKTEFTALFEGSLCGRKLCNGHAIG